ncbi:GntR family transcriptional regulator [Paucilactobacillus sp. N302-9]
MRIEPKASNSLRAQIVAAIQTDIFENRQIGEKLPSETEYAEKFGVTRSTIQKALIDLTEMNLIKKVQGKGSFVNMRQPIVKMFNFKGFSDYAKHIGATPITKVINNIIEERDGEKFMILRRLRSIKTATGAIPLTLDESHLSLSRFPNLTDFDFNDRSLYDTLREEYGVNPMTTTLKMSAIAADSQVKELLECKEADPLLQAQGTVFDANSEVVETVRIIYSQQTEFDINLGI